MAASTIRLVRFLRRYAWSVSLSGLSALSFLRLGSEMRAGELDSFDTAVARAVASFRGRFDASMLALTESGGFLGMTLLCVASALVLFGVRKIREATFVLVCGAGALILSSSLKILFHRARPDAVALYLLETPRSFSFPSGHALGSTCVVGALALVAYGLFDARSWRVLVSVLALAYVAGVALSRVYFGVHFPSDVIGGCLAGAAWVAAAKGWFSSPSRRVSGLAS